MIESEWNGTMTIVRGSRRFSDVMRFVLKTCVTELLSNEKAVFKSGDAVRQ